MTQAFEFPFFARRPAEPAAVTVGGETVTRRFDAACHLAHKAAKVAAS